MGVPGHRRLWTRALAMWLSNVPTPEANPNPTLPESMRFDVLLFELRLAKSRSQASEAIREGHALLNHQRAKPSRPVHGGDLVTLIGGGRRRTLQVLEIPRASLSKEAARQWVREVEGG